MSSRVVAVVSGHVQCVGFRYFVRGLAEDRDLTGSARNLPDGRVEALVEGDHEAVLRVERALRRGPSGAEVEQVVVEAAVPSGRATGFSIK